MPMLQKDTFEIDEAVELVTDRARVFAAELSSDGTLGANGGKDALEYDLMLAQIQVLGRHGLLSIGETESAAIEALLRQQSERTAKARASAAAYREFDFPENDQVTADFVPVTMTEIDSKLELAKLLIETGNSESARSILQDVLQDETAAKERIVEMARELEKARG